MRRLIAVVCAAFLGSVPAAALVTSTASATGNQSCVNLVDKCVGEQNSTSPTNYRGFGGYTAVNSYAPYAYQKAPRSRIASTACAFGPSRPRTPGCVGTAMPIRACLARTGASRQVGTTTRRLICRRRNG